MRTRLGCWNEKTWLRKSLSHGLCEGTKASAIRAFVVNSVSSKFPHSHKGKNRTNIQSGLQDSQVRRGDAKTLRPLDPKTLRLRSGLDSQWMGERLARRMPGICLRLALGSIIMFINLPLTLALRSLELVMLAIDGSEPTRQACFHRWPSSDHHQTLHPALEAAGIKSRPFDSSLYIRSHINIAKSLNSSRLLYQWSGRNNIMRNVKKSLVLSFMAMQ